MDGWIEGRKILKEKANKNNLGLVLRVLLGRSPRGGSKLEAFLVSNGGLLGLELGELVLHVLVVGGGLALLSTSSTRLLGRHCCVSKMGVVVRIKGFGLVRWTRKDGWRREEGKEGKERGEGRQRRGYLGRRENRPWHTSRMKQRTRPTRSCCAFQGQ